jgi:hypothetical protein
MTSSIFMKVICFSELEGLHLRVRSITPHAVLGTIKYLMYVGTSHPILFNFIVKYGARSMYANVPSSISGQIFNNVLYLSYTKDNTSIPYSLLPKSSIKKSIKSCNTPSRISSSHSCFTPLIPRKHIPPLHIGHVDVPFWYHVFTH